MGGEKDRSSGRREARVSFLLKHLNIKRGKSHSKTSFLFFIPLQFNIYHGKIKHVF